MTIKPSTYEGYFPEHTDRVRRTCLHTATFLGDLTDDLVVVGGLVPALLIDEHSLPVGAAAHVGTLDVDLGLHVALLEGARYEEIASRLRSAGYEPDRNDDGNPTVQRWKWRHGGGATIDFLMQPLEPGEKGGSVRHLRADFGAFVCPGLQFGWLDRRGSSH